MRWARADGERRGTTEVGRRVETWALLLLGLAGLLAAGMAGRQTAVAAAERPAPETAHLSDPDQRCAQCHAAIFQSYKKTAKARGSGEAVAGLLPGAYHDRASGVDYRVFLRDGAAWMSYARPHAGAGGELAGERRLELYVGSARRGRTYLYRMDDLWYELPINFYARANGWDLAPNTGGGAEMPAALPVDANCLHCHASGVQAPGEGVKNRFAGLPFTQTGVGCAACHGDPAAHLASGGKVGMVDVDRLPVARRDSVCLQCHLEGDAVVYRAGRSLSQFRAGDDLAEDAVYFVRANGAAEGLRATSQYEAMLRSACRRAVGDRMTCTTCHDPHSAPEPAERVQFFRARCVQCHSTPAIAERHHPEQPDCAACHMPSRGASDISHAQVTDHDIEARPRVAGQDAGLRLVGMARGDLLEPVGGVAVGDRERGLALAQMVRRGEVGETARATELLRSAEARGERDAEVEVELGYLLQGAGDAAGARARYGAALEQEPTNETAMADLAVLEVRSGDLAHGVPLLQRLVAADPGQTAAGLDLAFVACSLGKPVEARRLVEELLRVNPDDRGLREFLRKGRFAGRSCPGVVSAATPAGLAGREAELPEAPVRR